MDAVITLPPALQKIVRRKNLLVSLAIIALGCFLAYNIYKSQMTRLKNLKDEIAIEEQKIGLAKELGGLDEKVKGLSRPYLKGSSGAGIERFNEIASQTGARILSIIPEPERDLGLYTSTPFNLKLQADYRSVVAFLNKLEAQAGIVKIEDFLLKPLQPAKKDSPQDTGVNLLEVNIRVNIIFIKDAV